MLRSSLIAAGSVILCTAAAAQTGVVQSKVMQTAAKFGGTYHVATGTWTRNAPTSAQLGTGDIIYNNTANLDAWSSQTDDTQSYQIVDAGRIPTTGSAGSANRDNYNITDVTIGYCIDNNTANSADVLVTIYGSYEPCEDPEVHLCSGEFMGIGLPGATAANIANGWATCWTINFDLSGGDEICIQGDADGFFDSDLDFDSFGFGLEFDPGGTGGYVNNIDFGPIITGDRMWTVQATGEITASSGAGVVGCTVAATGGGGGTYYGPVECCTPTAGGLNSTGLDNSDFAYIGFAPGSPMAAAGCYYFGGYDNLYCAANGAGGVQPNPNGGNLLYMGLYSVIEADLTGNCVPSACGAPTGPTLVDFCTPASNNSTGAPAVLSGTGGSGFETDVHLDVSGGPLPLPGGSRMLGYFLVGNMATAGTPVGDGTFCLIGATGASFGRYNVAGTTRYSLGLFDANGDLENMVGTGGTSGYGFDIPYDILIAGTPLTTIVSGDTYHFQCWFRDTAAGIGHSNFTNGVSVTFP
ncbi:MAG: hypothetical protein GY930_03630 [bacterium]|nr:hypothetical protein [bacterium]